MISAFFTGFFLGLSLIVAIGAQNTFVLRQGIIGNHIFYVALFCSVSDAILICIGVAGISYFLNNFFNEISNDYRENFKETYNQKLLQQDMFKQILNHLDEILSNQRILTNYILEKTNLVINCQTFARDFVKRPSIIYQIFHIKS